MFFFNNPQLVILGPPNPFEFDDWESWAERLSDTLNNAAGLATSSGPPPFPPLTNGKFIITQSNDFIITQSGNFIVTQS